MVMRRVSAETKYYDFNNCLQGELLVDGFYNGKVPGKYKDQHEFKNISGELVVIGGGHLDFLVSRYLNPGTRCKVYFDGKTTMARGKYSGKAVKKFALEVEDTEDHIAPTDSRSPSAPDSTPPWSEGGVKVSESKATKKEEAEPFDDSMFDVE